MWSDIGWGWGDHGSLRLIYWVQSFIKTHSKMWKIPFSHWIVFIASYSFWGNWLCDCSSIMPDLLHVFIRIIYKSCLPNGIMTVKCWSIAASLWKSAWYSGSALPRIKYIEGDDVRWEANSGSESTVTYFQGKRCDWQETTQCSLLFLKSREAVFLGISGDTARESFLVSGTIRPP